MAKSKSKNNHMVYVVLGAIILVSLFAINYTLNNTSDLKGSVNKVTVSQTKNAAKQAKSNVSSSIVTNNQIRQEINNLSARTEDQYEQILQLFENNRQVNEDQYEQILQLFENDRQISEDQYEQLIRIH